MKPTIMTILGTRPEVVKLAPIILTMQGQRQLQPLVCATAQHRDMLDVALDVFGIVPDIDLDLMRPGQQLHEITSRVMKAVSEALEEVRPDFVLVQGDTTTAMVAAMACFYQGIPVGHVEAGLRTGDMANPFPEEMNRKVLTALATLHFAPTPRAQQALLAEGVRPESIYVTGNTVIDALFRILDRYPVTEQPIRRRILVTAHRRESFGGPFERLCAGLRRIALNHPEIDIIYPVHLNPRVQDPVRRLLSDLPNVQLIEPLGYRDFVLAMRDSYLILTDSGGVQEEAPSLGKPILVMREVTERPEAIEAGAAILVGTDTDRIVGTCEWLLSDRHAYERMAAVRNPFGDGLASRRVIRALATYLGVDIDEMSEDIAIA